MKRRQFLRGAGLSLALPFLDSLQHRGACFGSQSQAANPPLRSVFIHFPNGVWEADWVPTSTGANFELSKTLSPLESVRSRILVVTGLDQPNSRGGDGHYAKTANFLTGMTVQRTEGRDISAGGISVDQLMASKFGHQTPISSLVLGAEPVRTGLDPTVGYTKAYGSYISWRSPSLPATPIVSPKAAYRSLFGSLKSASPQTTLLLDHVLEDANRIRRRLGRDDRPRMDEYLDSVRAVESKLEFLESEEGQLRKKSGKIIAQEPIDPVSFADRANVLLEIVALAFQSDSTRVSSLMLGSGVSNVNFSFLPGVKGEHHELSHHENRMEKIQQYQKINQWYVEQFRNLIHRLDSIPEGDGTLLDSCLVLFGSGMSDGNRHDPGNLPILLAGGSRANVPLGQHMHFENGTTPLCNLYVSILNAVGIPTTQFGCSTGKIF
ncbi:MAG: DUF1552 domain-containing protein [Planctomycetaceae bacterium]|nr:DUF1552 domain-containing protein [Planctomycetaceae bacterium]